MGLFKNKKGKPSKFAGILKGVLQNPTIRTIVPGGNLLGAAVGVLVPDKEGNQKIGDKGKIVPADYNEISNPLLKDIAQFIAVLVSLGTVIITIIEVLKS